MLEWKEPFAKWFVGGKLNVSENCLDRHLAGAPRNKAAMIWEGEPGEKRDVDLPAASSRSLQVCQRSQAESASKRGSCHHLHADVPEAAIAMLACARIGAIHSVVFGGFSAESIKDRIKDCGARMVITADGGYRRGAIVPLKKNVDERLKGQ